MVLKVIASRLGIADLSAPAKAETNLEEAQQCIAAEHPPVTAVIQLSDF